jgi:hypothetical protein
MPGGGRKSGLKIPLNLGQNGKGKVVPVRN